jgi:glycosyltransferase involved in cell wall biosynthesis
MKIVVLTKNYGKDVTGATLATHTFIHLWAKTKTITEIIVLAQHLFHFDEDEKIHIIQYDSRFKISGLIRKYASEDTIFYSDDHYGYFLADASVKYVHTYHGNWPDARYLNLEYFLKSFYFIFRYSETIKHAAQVINVSDYMEKFTKRYNSNSITIRNGVNILKRTEQHSKELVRDFKCLMLGNIDARKYGKLPALINEMHRIKMKIDIDIYGRIIDRRLERVLRTYKEIHLKGFISSLEIDFSQYLFLLSTSTRENLPISIVEIMKIKIPVVAFRVGGIPEVVNENCGQLFDTSDIENMACFIKRVLNHDIVFDFNNKVLEEFDWKKSSKKYLDIFYDLC